MLQDIAVLREDRQARFVRKDGSRGGKVHYSADFVTGSVAPTPLLRQFVPQNCAYLVVQKLIVLAQYEGRTWLHLPV